MMTAPKITRAERYRKANLLERLPDTRALDVAISAGLASWLASTFGGDVSRMRKSPAALRLLGDVERALLAQGIDTRHPLTTERLRARLRLGRPTSRRTTL